MNNIRHHFARLLRDERGLSAIEYGVLASLIVIAAIQALDGLGTETRSTYHTSTDKLEEQTAVQQAKSGDGAQDNPDEPAVSADAPLDDTSGSGNPDEPPAAAMTAPQD